MKRSMHFLALGVFLFAVEPATAQGETPDRYWLKGIIVSPDKGECDYDCPSEAGVSVVVRSADAYGLRQTGGMFPSEFGFGPPMDPGTSWTVEIARQPEFYKCSITRGAAGTVVPDERAINVAFAMHVTDIQCNLTAAGRAEWKRLADARNPPPISRAYLVGRWASNAGCAQTIEFRSDGTFVIPIGQGTWELNGDQLTTHWRGQAQSGQYWIIDDRTVGHLVGGTKSQSSRC